jgi:hypothetical protein
LRRRNVAAGDRLRRSAFIEQPRFQACGYHFFQRLRMGVSLLEAIGMRKALIAVALCFIFLLPPILLVHQQHRESKLKAERDAISQRIQDEIALERNTDPEIAEVEKRDAVATDLHNSARSKEADNWFDANLSDPKEGSKYDAMRSVHILLGAIQMMKDPVAQSLLHDFILDTPPQSLPSEQQKEYAEIPLKWLSTLRLAISRCSGNHDTRRLDDTSELWNVLSNQTAVLEKCATDQAEELRQGCRNWPAVALREVSICPEEGLKGQVYTYYINTHRPADIMGLAQRRYAIEQSLHK